MLQPLERIGLLATRALSAIGLAGLLVLALMTLLDGLARWLLNQPIEWSVCAISFASAAVLLAIGLCWFQRLERRLADIV